MDFKLNGKVSVVCFLFIMIINMMFIIIGSIFVVVIKLGIYCNFIRVDKFKYLYFLVFLYVFWCIVCFDF